MSYTVEPLDVVSSEKVVETRTKRNDSQPQMWKWWDAQTDQDLLAQVLSTTAFLKRTNQARIRQASIYSRLFCGKPLYSYLAANSSLDSSNQLPIGRPTANVVYSCTDTVTSNLCQEHPKPTFLTDGGNYRDRKLAKEANQFLQGELYRTKAYDIGALVLRDGCVLGDGMVKVGRRDGKVHLERVLATEVYTDFNDAYYGDPRQLIQCKLIDRSMAKACWPDKVDVIDAAVSGNVDSTPRSTETITDQFIASEAWHLPSGEDAKDGRHVIVCSAGVIMDERWTRKRFPFVKFGYNPNLVGWFSQGLAEILMPIQMELYRTIIVASQSLELMGVPRIYIEETAKILETSFNNRIGTIIKGRGAPPQFINAQSNTPEFYEWIKWLIELSYAVAGVSQLSATSEKPAGLNSGEAIRSYLDSQAMRFTALTQRYHNLYLDLSYLILDEAKEIADETGKYSTVYPGKNGLHEVDFKIIDRLKDSYVVQLFEESSLPKDPAGRQAKLSEMLAAGEVSLQEFRRLSNFPDLEQSDQLATALEERILHALDEIVDNGAKNFADIAPDSFMLDPSDLASTLCTQYINRYATLQLEEEKMQALRDWFTAVQTVKAEATPPPMAAPAQGSPLPVAPPNPSVAPTSAVNV